MSRATGFKRARSAAKKRPAVLDRAVVDAISETVDAVHAEGVSNINALMTRRTGLLRRRYRRQMRAARKTGVVGYVTLSSARAAFYARFVHDGTRYITARPFHDLAVASQREKHRARMLRAKRRAIGDATGRG